MPNRYNGPWAWVTGDVTPLRARGTCADCERVYFKHSMLEVGEHLHCRQCARIYHRFFKCGECGEGYHEIHLSWDPGARRALCRYCYERAKAVESGTMQSVRGRRVQCVHCDHTIYTGSSRNTAIRNSNERVPMRYLCQECRPFRVVGCIKCGVTTNSMDIPAYEDDDCNRPVCGHCVASLPICCRSCERQVPHDEAVTNPRTGRAYCPECARDRIVSCTFCEAENVWGGDQHLPCCDRCRNACLPFLHSYNYVPDTHHFHPKWVKGLVYYGAEIETDGYKTSEREPIARKVTEKYGSSVLYCVSDGSLRSGVEICTHPRTLRSWRKEAKTFQNLFADVVEYGAHNTGKAGLHIHRDRRDITNRTEYKLIKFFLKCAPQIQEVARRAHNANAQFEWYARQAGENERVIYSRLKAKSTGDKYCAINLLHENTIEFRIFNGVLSWGLLIAALEFTAAVVEFCKNVGVGQLQHRESGLLWNSFTRFIQARGKQYRHVLPAFQRVARRMEEH